MYRFIVTIFFSTLLVHGLEWQYHNNTELENFLTNFTQSTQGEVKAKLYPIGSSIKGHELLALRLTAAKTGRIGVPNIKLIGTVHGNEPVGREILLHFMEYLRDNYKKDAEITWLLDHARIHFLPNLNPEGFALSHENMCNGEHVRSNGKNGVDLNRNFPDYYHDNRIPEQPESKAIKKWLSDVPFILSAALHGGALVVNYPFDTVKEMNSDGERVPSLTPDNDVFVHLAKVYSHNHLTMHKGQQCNDFDPKFEEGITNGAAWYVVVGGMQDYNYAFHGCMELTLEISCCKYPSAKELPRLWEENKTALLKYCLEALKGVTGRIVDAATLKPVFHASLRISGRNITFYTTKTGEFWRLLLPGNYELEVSAEGYYDQVVSFEVKSYEAKPQLTVLNIAMMNSSISTTTEQRTTETTIKLTEKEEDGASTENLFTNNVIARNAEKPTPASLSTFSTGKASSYNEIYFVVFAIIFLRYVLL